ncbi:leucine-rich repeat domain-containing protein [Pseudomonas sp. R4-76]|uniref:leucine-rich repeat domain-containing protein n=1 Tax=unclassified Pseudomonas TaxID=196821 RepID=UPI003DA8F85F
MPVKPPRGGGNHVDVPASANRSADADQSLSGQSGRRSADSSSAQDNLQPRAGSSSESGRDAVGPVAVVEVHASPTAVHRPPPLLSLDDYATNARAILPQINDDGLRLINRRIYADLANGDLVLVAADPATGLYRARRPSELLPSGPVLLRDVASGHWYPRQLVERTTRAQVKKYLSQASDLDADAFIARFDDKDVADAELQRIQRGSPQLDIEHIRIPYHEPRMAYDGQMQQALDMWGKLRQVYEWHGQPDQRVYSDGRLSGYKLDINLTLWPVDKLLSLRFSAVVSLTLKGHAPLDAAVFFRQFPNIESLTISSQVMTNAGSGLFMFQAAQSRFSMESSFAGQLTGLTRLRELNLQNCNLPAGFSLRGLSRLQVLRLVDTQVTVLTEHAGPWRPGEPVQHWADYSPVEPDLTGMTELRVLDLTRTGIRRLPSGLDAGNGPSKLEVLKLGDNPIYAAPSLKAMTALQELDLSHMGLDGFPEGITSMIPEKVLNLANNRITAIPASVELRAGFNLIGNPITDPASLRRLLYARNQTGNDIWLGTESSDLSANLWLQHVPAEQLARKLQLWGSVSHLARGLKKLSRTPEFYVERPLLQRRVWSFLEIYDKADVDEQLRLNQILAEEPSPVGMLEKLEEEIRTYDSTRQNQPLHHLPKRPKLD